MASRLASLLRSSASRRPRSPAGHFLRFAAHYATASPTVSKSESSAGHGGKITDEFTGQGAIGKVVLAPYQRGGKIGLLGGAGVGKTGLLGGAGVGKTGLLGGAGVGKTVPVLSPQEFPYSILYNPTHPKHPRQFPYDILEIEFDLNTTNLATFHSDLKRKLDGIIYGEVDGKCVLPCPIGLSGRRIYIRVHVTLETQESLYLLFRATDLYFVGVENQYGFYEMTDGLGAEMHFDRSFSKWGRSPYRATTFSDYKNLREVSGLDIRGEMLVGLSALKNSFEILSSTCPHSLDIGQDCPRCIISDQEVALAVLFVTIGISEAARFTDILKKSVEVKKFIGHKQGDESNFGNLGEKLIYWPMKWSKICRAVVASNYFQSETMALDLLVKNYKLKFDDGEALDSVDKARRCVSVLSCGSLNNLQDTMKRARRAFNAFCKEKRLNALSKEKKP